MYISLRIIFVIGLICQVSFLQTLNAFELQTHTLMTRNAYNLSVLNRGYLLDQLGIRQDQIFKGLIVRDWMESGSVKEDDHLSGSLSPVFLRFRHHFWDPHFQRGLTNPLLSGNRAYEWALEESSTFSGQDYSWRDARQYFFTGLTAQNPSEREDAMAKTFRAIGQVAHMVQDMGQPQHTRNDIHGGVPFLGLNELSLFEYRIEGRPEQYNYAGYPVPTFNQRQHFWWTNDGTGRGLAEFTNRNFISDTTNFRRTQEGDLGIGNFPSRGLGSYPSPQLRLGPGYKFDVDVSTLPEQPQLTGKVTFFGNDISDNVTGTSAFNQRMTTYSLFDSALSNKGQQEIFTYNRYTVDASASLLLPRAVGYSAGLIDHFFRGKVDLNLVQDDTDPTIVRVEGKNDSSEKLDGGTLELYGDDAQGNRTVATPVGSTTVIADAGQPISVSYRLPSNSEKFMAVYKGKLGEEAPNGDFPGAVVGKVVEGVIVEQLISSSGRWHIRTPDGVFSTDILVQDVQDLQWGDNDNTLVGRSRIGPGQPNMLYSYILNRPLKATNVPLRALPDPVSGLRLVDLQVQQQIPFPFGLATGTSVQYTGGVNFSQHLLYQLVTRDLQWDEASHFYLEIPGSEVRTYGSDLVGTDQKTINRSYSIVLNVDNFSSQGRPHIVNLGDISLTADGRILLILRIGLSFTEESATFDMKKVVRPTPNDGNIAPQIVPDNPVTVQYEFPGDTNPLFWLVLDVTNGQILHSTAPAVVSVGHTRHFSTGNRVPLDAIFVTGVTLVRARHFGGNSDGHFFYIGFNDNQDLLWNSCPEQQNSFVSQGSFSVTTGETESIANRFRTELAQVAQSSTQSRTVVDTRPFCGNPSVGIPPGGFTVTRQEQQSRFANNFQIMRTAPGTSPEQFVVPVLLPQAYSFDVDYSYLKWTPASGTAEVRKNFFGGDDYILLGTTPSQILVQSRLASLFFDNGPKLLVPTQGSSPELVMTGVEDNEFYLLDPDYLYDANARKFFTKAPMPQVTSLPKTLANAPSGNPKGRYHLLRVVGPVN